MQGFQPKFTYCLIALCILVAIFTQWGEHFDRLRPFLITNYVNHGLSEISDGEVWRLISPVFIHFGILHLALNMVWLWQLGQLVEYSKSPAALMLILFSTGVTSNLVEFYATGPLFGGMSGVIFALLVCQLSFFTFLHQRAPAYSVTLNHSFLRIWHYLYGAFSSESRLVASHSRSRTPSMMTISLPQLQ